MYPCPSPFCGLGIWLGLLSLLAGPGSAGPAFIPRNIGDIPGGPVEIPGEPAHGSATNVPTAGPMLPSVWRGPSSSKGPYFAPIPGGVEVVVSVLTVGDMPTADTIYRAKDNAVGTNVGTYYRLVGKPDGLGLMLHPEDPRLFVLFVTHEIPLAQGVPRAHGAPGAFVSRWEIRFVVF